MERASRNSKSDSTVVFVGEAVTQTREVQKVSGGMITEKFIHFQTHG